MGLTNSSLVGSFLHLINLLISIPSESFSPFSSVKKLENSSEYIEIELVQSARLGCICGMAEEEELRNMTQSNSTSICNIINMDGIFYGLSAVFGLLAIMGIAGNLLLLSLLPTAHLVHKNVRYMMLNMTGAALLLCIFSGGRAGYDFLIIFHVITLATPISPFACSLIEIPATIAAFFMVLCIFGMGAERMYATWKRASSDRSSQWLPKMIIALWIASASTTLVQLASASHTPSLCYCHTILSFHKIVLFITCCLYFFVEIPALVMYFVVRRWNRIRVGSLVGASLSERFQTWNTLRATEMLLSSVIMHGVCLTIVEMGSFIAHWFYFTKSNVFTVDATSLTVLHLITFFLFFHAATHPYIAIWKSEHLKKHAKRRINSIMGRKTNVTGQTGTAVYQIGQKMTNGHFEPLQQTTSLPADPDQHSFQRAPRVPDKARQRMGVPARQKTTSGQGPAYQVYQITPEQSAALLQRFWK